MTSAARPELNLVVLGTLAHYIEDHLGAGAAEDWANAAGLVRADIDGKNRWVTWEQFEALLAHARTLIADDAEFQRACAYRLQESGFGPMSLVLWAATPRTVLKTAMRTVSAVSAISHYEILHDSPTQLKLRYTSQRPESRLMCLSRQAQGRALPTLWGLPPAQFTEHACIARGDPACEYDVRLYAQRRWFPALIGGAAGVGLALLAEQLGIGSAPIWLLLGVVGLALGHVLELQRTNRLNLEVATSIHEGLRELALEDAQARREILELHERARAWEKAMQLETSERNAALQSVVEQLRRTDEKVVALHGYGHDLRSPLSVLSLVVGSLAANDLSEEERLDFLADARSALERLTNLVGELYSRTRPDEPLVRLQPRPIDVAALTEDVQRRLAALTRGSDVQCSTIRTREAPSTIDTDRMMLDRVIDNLLTNAVKYTPRGSVVVSVDGKPGHLVLKIHDTGVGMSEDRLHEVLAGRPRPDPRVAQSTGVGLSVVAQLLAQMGGTLEIISRLDMGTTVWIDLPERTPEATQPDVARVRSV